LGLKTQEDADDVRSYYHRSYWGTSRLDVRETIAIPKGALASETGRYSNGQETELASKVEQEPEPEPVKIDPPSHPTDYPTPELGMTDLEYMRSRMRRLKDDGEIRSDNGDDVMTKPTTSLQPKPAQMTVKEQILATGRLFLRNLSFQCTSEDLQSTFEAFGKISEVSHHPSSPSSTATTKKKTGTTEIERLC